MYYLKVLKVKNPNEEISSVALPLEALGGSPPPLPVPAVGIT